MSILKKFNLSIFLVSFIFLVVILIILNSLIIKGYQRSENQIGLSNLKRLELATNRISEILDTKVIDWAWWDDTYKFLQDKNIGYVKSNVTSVGMSGLNLKSMIFVDKDNSVILAKSVTADKLSLESVSPNILKNFEKESSLFEIKSDEGKKTGFFKADNKVYVFIVRPVLRGDKTGPRAGFIVFIEEFLPQIPSLKDVLQLPVKLDERILKSKTEKQWLDYKNEQLIVGNLKLYDYTDKPIGILSFDLGREVTLEGKKNVEYVLILISIIFGFSVVFYYFLLRILVLNKILKLNFEVSSVNGQQGKFSKVNDIPGGDEMSELASNINKMIFKLQSTTELTKDGRTNVGSYIDVVDMMVIAVGIDERVVLINKKASEVLGIEQDLAVGINWFDTFVDESSREEVRRRFKVVVENNFNNIDNFESMVLTKYGKSMISWRNSVLKNSSGELSVFILVGEDVSRNKESERLEKERMSETKRLLDLMVDREAKMIEMKEEMGLKKVKNEI